MIIIKIFRIENLISGLKILMLKKVELKKQRLMIPLLVFLGGHKWGWKPNPHSIPPTNSSKNQKIC